MAIKVFVRQPLTQTTEREARIVQAALDGIGALVGEGRFVLEFLTGTKAHDNDSFRQAFTSESGGAFEVAYGIYGGRRIPMLFAVWDEAAIKTTLLRDLDDLAKVRYVRFSDPLSVAASSHAFSTTSSSTSLSGRGPSVVGHAVAVRRGRGSRRARALRRRRQSRDQPRTAAHRRTHDGAAGAHEAARARGIATFEPAAEAYLDVEAKTA